VLGGDEVLVWERAVDGPRGRVRRALTGRAGGASSAPWSGLNLGDHVGDDPAAVAANRAVVATAVGVEPGHLVMARQVHGTDVVVVEGPWDGEPPAADALVTSLPGLALAVLVADCVPVLLVAPREGVVAVAHAGRRGMDDGVVPAVLGAMRDLGATTLHATVGPSVCAGCYEVPAALRDEVAARHPVTASHTRHGAPALDVAAGVLQQLAACCRDVEQLPGCTAERDDLYSFRRDGVTGRFAGLAWLEPR
jgi:YfiH family protein